MGYGEGYDERVKHFDAMFRPAFSLYKWLFDTIKNLGAVVALGVIAKKGHSVDVYIFYKIASYVFQGYIALFAYNFMLPFVPQSDKIIIRTVVAVGVLVPVFGLIGLFLGTIESRVVEEMMSIQGG